MRLEVIIDNEEPLIFPLNRPKIVIGSHESCDIVLNTNGVSRKHLIVVTEGDNFFVIDQGSTNGSYINEERLIPGRRAEFTSFFPVRLGDNVLLTLLSDEEAAEESLTPLSEFKAPAAAGEVSTTPKTAPSSPPASSDATRVISLKDLKSASTTGLVKKKLERQAIRKNPGKKAADAKNQKKKKGLGFVELLAIIIILVAGYFNLVMKKVKDQPKPPPAQIGEVIKKEPEKKEGTPTPPQPTPVASNGIASISEQELIAPTSVKRYLSDLKCATEIEKIFCSKIPQATEHPWGVIQGSGKIIILLPKNVASDLLDVLIKGTLRTLKDLSPQDYNALMHLLFWTKVFPNDLEIEKIKDFKIFVAFFDAPETVHSMTAIVPENLPKLWKETMGNKGIDEIRQRGIIRAKRFREYFVSY